MLQAYTMHATPNTVQQCVTTTLVPAVPPAVSGPLSSCTSCSSGGEPGLEGPGVAPASHDSETVRCLCMFKTPSRSTSWVPPLNRHTICMQARTALINDVAWRRATVRRVLPHSTAQHTNMSSPDCTDLLLPQLSPVAGGLLALLLLLGACPAVGGVLGPAAVAGSGVDEAPGVAATAF
jgi:hypothetical protein